MGHGCSGKAELTFSRWTVVVSDPLRDNLAHPAKIDFLVEAFIAHYEGHFLTKT